MRGAINLRLVLWNWTILFLIEVTVPTQSDPGSSPLNCQHLTNGTVRCGVKPQRDRLMKSMSSPKLEELARLAFVELTSVALCGKTVNYEDLGRSIGAHYFFTLPRVLGLLWGWCEQKGLPHINALAVSKKSGVPGDGYQPSNRPTSKEGWQRVWREVHCFNWRSVAYGEECKRR